MFLLMLGVEIGVLVDGRDVGIVSLVACKESESEVQVTIRR